MSEAVYRSRYRLGEIPTHVVMVNSGEHAFIDIPTTAQQFWHGVVVYPRTSTDTITRHWLKSGDTILYDANWNAIAVEPAPLRWETLSTRERDALVAEHVMGGRCEIQVWQVGFSIYRSVSWYIGDWHFDEVSFPTYTGPGWLGWNRIPEVEEQIAKRRLEATYLLELAKVLGFEVPADKPLSARHLWSLVSAEPEKRCLAALRAAGVEV